MPRQVRRVDGAFSGTAEAVGNTIRLFQIGMVVIGFLVAHLESDGPHATDPEIGHLHFGDPIAPSLVGFRRQPDNKRSPIVSPFERGCERVFAVNCQTSKTFFVEFDEGSGFAVDVATVLLELECLVNCEIFAQVDPADVAEIGGVHTEVLAGQCQIPLLGVGDVHGSRHAKPGLAG
ncbi:hypothetical protein SDC9_181041 [bioreactor metagenome]|uniref:Uncharacterized protein n=1 Tax=bioreactor metagenome TaxID=1076179 RepID=A0A645H5D4_9ZZZZ